ncbi:MAG TPA: large conductance mechanosensitive channel protein MscL [Candidatus Limnocylindria bacterium]|nr:large conductance mechanosensitive channel protein MscL [Candidatus Limnocylindria bacterium]
MIGEFRAFLLKTSALALAIGVIIGVALGSVVTSLVDDLIMPPVGRIIGGVDVSAMAVDLGGGAAIRYGAFINTVIAFVIIAFVVFWISRLFIRPEPEPEPTPMKTCPYCREQVHRDATKCRYCASMLPAAGDEPLA